MIGKAGGKIGGVGSTKPDRDSKSLGGANGDIGAQFARGGKEKKGERISHEDGEGARFF